MDNLEFINREIEARNRAEAAYREILKRAQDETRDTTPEEDEQLERALADSKKRKARIDQLEALDAERKSAGEVRQIVGGTEQRTEARHDVDSQIVDSIRGMLAAMANGGETPLERNFTIDRPAKVPFNHDETRTIESMAGITGQQSEFSRQVGVYARTLSPWIGISRVFNGTEGSPLILPRLTTDLTSYTPGQGTAITASSPVITAATATPSAYKALSYITQEAAQDDQIGLLDLIAKDCGRVIGLAFGSAVTTAVLSGFTNGGTAAGTPFFLLTDLMDLIYDRAVPYRQNGVFVMATGAVEKTRKFTDTNGQFLWQPSSQAGQPDRLLGYAVYEDPNLATPASATKSVLFGDPSEYVIKQLPLRVAVSTDYAFNTDLVAVKVVYRAGGAVRLADAMAYLVSKDT